MAWCLVHYFVPGRGAKYCNECACVWSVLSVCLSTCISHKPQVHTCYVWPWLGPSVTTVLLWSPYVIGQAIIFLPCDFYLLSSYFFASLISAAADWMFTIWYFHTWCGPSVNLECRSEMCCTRLSGNTGRKKSPFWHHRTSFRAICSELRHVSTIGKKTC